MISLYQSISTADVDRLRLTPTDAQGGSARRSSQFLSPALGKFTCDIGHDQSVTRPYLISRPTALPRSARYGRAKSPMVLAEERFSAACDLPDRDCSLFADSCQANATLSGCFAAVYSASIGLRELTRRD